MQKVYEGFQLAVNVVICIFTVFSYPRSQLTISALSASSIIFTNSFSDVGNLAISMYTIMSLQLYTKMKFLDFFPAVWPITKEKNMVTIVC